MFGEPLKSLIDHTEGGMAAIILALDGIVVESYVKPELDAEQVELMSAEIVAVLKQWRAASSAETFGTANEFILRSDKTSLIFKVMKNEDSSDEYVLALVVEASKPAGKGRFYMRVAEQILLPEL